MAKFIGKRLLMLLPVVLGVVFIVFTILRLSPTDPIRTVLGDMATEEAVQEMREEMGLNDPFFVQFYNYIKGIVTKFDFGVSYVNRHPVVDEIKDRFPITLELAILSTLLAGLIGIPLGIISAVHQYKLIDNISSVFALIFLAMPGFWFALILIIQFSLKWRLLPASGWYGVKYMILPILANGTGCIAGIMRTTRSNMLEVIRQDYIRTARAKGLSEHKVIYHHAFRNTLIPLVTFIGGSLPGLFAGALITETLFAIPGIGFISYNAMVAGDIPFSMFYMTFLAILTLLGNLISDILYAVVDPRVRIA